MPNMSYCRWENTAADFDECMDSLDNKDFHELSESERKSFIKLYKLASKFVEWYELEDLIEQHQKLSQEESL